MIREATILFVEDDEESNKIYSDFFNNRATTVISAKDGQDALNKFIIHTPNLVVTDIRMPGMNGAELINAIRNIDIKVPIIVLSAYANNSVLNESFRDKVNEYIQKPINSEELDKIVSKYLDNKNEIEEILAGKQNEQVDEEIMPKTDNSDGLMVVGIGSSAGGLEALSALVSGLPKNNKSAYVVAQHLSPSHKTMLVDLLGRETELDIKDAIHGETLKSDTIYITPPNKNIELNSRNEIVLSVPDKNSFLPKPSVNKFFISLAEHKKDKSVGIILSGTGTDGAQGMRAINAEGGITIVQEPSSAKYDGMPVASISGSNVDMILEAENIGEELVALANFPRNKVLKKYQITEPNDDLSLIFQLLLKHKKVDFSFYKKTTIGRRLERRMVAVKVTNLSDYVDILTNDAKEVESLYQDILIGVTHFFREKEAFNSLKKLINNYLKDNPDQRELRIWMPGSSTGEEAYSIAITLKEILLHQAKSIDVRIFATDIDENALKVARKGLFSEASMHKMENSYIKEHFNVKGDEFEVKKSLRQNIVFSYHNILTDPPFKDLDLIVCRNLLIYFNLEAQRHIMPSFHYGLKNNAILFLGKSENASNFEHFFAPMDKVNKIFKKIPASNKDYKTNVIQPLKYITSSNQTEETIKTEEITLQERITLEAAKILMPNVIVTNEQFEVVYKKGSLSYIKIPEGYITYNIFKMVDQRLSIDLRTLVNNAKKQNKMCSSPYITISNDDKTTQLLKIYVVPIVNKRTNMYVFYFHELSEMDMPQIPIGKAKKDDITYNQLLELELNRTKEHLQTVIEELETTNEELQSSNEELQSSNEELQSTNEELETSNEELQSTNEELHTAYSELSELYNTNSTINDKNASLGRRYEALLDNVNEAVVVTNSEGLFIRTNKAMQMLTGLSRESLLAKTWYDFILSEDIPFINMYNQEAKLKGKYGPYDIVIYDKDGLDKTLRIHQYMSKDEDNKIQIWFFASDVTLEKQMQKELLESRQLAEVASKSKSNFLANMSHEIRTPLNAINGFIDKLHSIESDDIKKSYLEIIKSSSHDLLHLINDILDISKIESQKLEINPIDFDTKEELRKAFSLFKAQAETKNIDMSFDLKDLPDYLNGDILRLKQILKNIVSNAIKFTSNYGVIKIKSSYDKYFLKFEIEDNGSGIPDDKKDLIFQKFTQADNSITRNHGGSGLGLSISKELVTLMGGEIYIKDAKPHGSIFCFNVNFKKAKKIVLKKINEENIQLKGKILIAEDNKTNQLLIEMLLDDLGLETYIVYNAQDVLEQLPIVKPNLILMDINMPIMNGIEGTKAIRNDTKYSKFKDIPIIALTANALKGDKEHFLSVGFDGYLAKPLDKHKLIEELSQYL